MIRKLWHLLLLAAVLGLAQPVWADDGFYVIAGGGRVGTPISSLPCTIDQPGFYYLKGNLSTTGSGIAIAIEASDVTLDLMGFCLTGPGSTGTGIFISAGINNLEVRNGNVANFYYGIFYSDGRNQRFANLKVRSCNSAIYGYGATDGFIVTGCEVTNNSWGITSSASAAIIDKNTASYNTIYGFKINGLKGGVVTNNAAYGNGTGFLLPGTPGTLVDRNSSSGNTANWAGLSGCTQGLNTP